MADSTGNAAASEFDVFICFATADKKKSLEIQSELERRNVRCFHCDKDFIGGLSIICNILNGIFLSRKVIFLVSRDFVKSKWAQLEVNKNLSKAKNLELGFY